MEEKLAERLASRRVAKGRFTRKIKFLENAIAEKSSVELLESAWAEVATAYKSVEDISEEILEIIGEDEQEASTHEAWLSEVSKTYRDSFNKYCNYKSSLKDPKVTTLALQRLEPPKFDGSCRSFITWKKHYNRLVVPQRGKDPYVLLSCLSPEVKKKVGNLDDYDLIFKRLEDEYGDLKSIVTTVLSDLDSLQKAEEGNKVSVVNVIDAIERVWLELTSMNYGEHLNNPTNLLKAEVLLPDNLRVLWLQEEKAIDDKDPLKHEKFIDFLRGHRTILQRLINSSGECGVAGVSMLVAAAEKGKPDMDKAMDRFNDTVSNLSNIVVNLTNSSSGAHTGTGVAGQPVTGRKFWRCILHRADQHFLSLCPEVIAMNANARNDLVSKFFQHLGGNIFLKIITLFDLIHNVIIKRILNAKSLIRLKNISNPRLLTAKR